MPIRIYRVSQDKHNCRVSKNVVYGYNCKCTALSHLDQHIGLNKHKLNLLVKDHAAECNVSQEKKKLARNYPRWRYGRKRNYLVKGYRNEKPVCRLSAKNRGSDWSSKQCHRVLIAPPLSPSQKECETNPSREQKNAAVFANRIIWIKITITSLTEAIRMSTIMYLKKEKIDTLNVMKRFCMQAQNRPETFWETQARTRSEPGPTYNSAPLVTRRFSVCVTQISTGRIWVALLSRAPIRRLFGVHVHFFHETCNNLWGHSKMSKYPPFHISYFT